MTPDEQRALEAIPTDWADAPDDVWSESPFHVEALHRSATRRVLAGIRDAESSGGASPIGVVIQGDKGVGKTHLLGTIRQRVQETGNYFFLIQLLGVSGDQFWRSTVQGYLDDLNRPSQQGGHQITMLLGRLCELAGVGKEVQDAVCGHSAVTRADLDEFARGLRRADRQVGTDAQDTARALALHASDGAAHEIGRDFLSLADDGDLDARAEWGIRRSRAPRLIVRDLSRLIALTGAAVVAIDQIDTLLAQSRVRIGEPGAGDPAMDLVLSQVADGLMSLRDETRRTLSVLSCLPSSWNAIRTRAVASAADRFDALAPIEGLPNAPVAEELIRRRFAVYYARAEFSPPYPTWPIRPEAFAGAAHYPARGLLQVVGAHVQACLAANRITELDHFGEPAQSVPDAQMVAVSGADLQLLDGQFEQLRRDAEFESALVHETEDARITALLRAGLQSVVAEHAGAGIELTVDGPPARHAPLHARIRLVLDAATEDEAHWAFRGIATENARAFQSRLSQARTEAGLQAGIAKRRLVIIRNSAPPSGQKTAADIAAFERDGGIFAVISGDDLRTFAALEAILRTGGREVREWLRVRRPASATEFFATYLIPGFGPESRDPEETPAGGETARGAEPGAPRIVVGIAAPGRAGFGVDVEQLRQHAMIVAGTGSGKTVLLRRLVEECALLGVSSIVLDPNNDLARLGDPWPEEPEGWTRADRRKAAMYHSQTDVVVFTPGHDGGRPLHFRPLPDFASLADDRYELKQAVESATASLAVRMSLAGSARGPLLARGVLADALRRFAERGGGTLDDFIGLLSSLPSGVSAISNASRHAVALADSLRAVLAFDPVFGGGDNAVDPGELLTPAAGSTARVSVISFIGLPTEVQRQSWVNTLQQELFSWVKRNPAGDRPLGGLLVMDEAQTLAPAGKSTPSTDSTLTLVSQARKYGLGLLFATQAPKSLHNSIPGNAATHFFGRLSAPAQIAAAMEMARARNSAIGDIAQLGKGEFYGASEGGIFEKVRTALCLSYHPRSPLTQEEVLDRARRAL